MRKRPLAFLLLVFLLIQSLKLIGMSGQSLVKVPAYSIFSEYETASGVIVQGQIYKKAIRSEYQILYLKNNSITYQEKTYQESYLLVYDNSVQQYKIGQSVTVMGSLSVFEEARNPGNFDEKLYYAKQKLFGEIWCEEVVDVRETENRFHEKLFEMRTKWNNCLMCEMGEEKGAILSAMLLGERSSIEPEIKELYQKNGFGHLLAISGLHISFIGLGVYHFFRKIGLSFGVSGSFAIGILALYVLLLGFSVSIFRAFLMLFLRLLAEMTGRVYDMVTAVILSAALLVMYEPLYLTDGGFQLSHGAILAIYYVIPVLEKLGVKKPFSASVAITISLFPITLWHYYEISTYAVLWNLIVIPLMSVLLGLGMFGSLIPFGRVLFVGCKVILEVYEVTGKIGNMLPGNRLVLGKPSIITIIFFYVWLIMVVVIVEKGKHPQKIMLIGFLLMGLLFIKVPDGKLRITMLDVGQGDCIYFKGPKGTHYLVDGGSSSVKEVGRYRIESFLKYEGVGVVEYVFLSHGDTDHINGIQEMIERQVYGVKINNLILPENYKEDEKLLEIAKLAKEQGIRVFCIRKGETLVEGELVITCLQPGKSEKGLDSNAASMVLDISFGEFSMLFTGDVEGEGEKSLIEKLKGRDYDILKVAHHGSKNSTSEAFLEVVRPKIALVSVGKNNYGHPHKETMERLKKVGSKVLITREEGAIMLLH